MWQAAVLAAADIIKENENEKKCNIKPPTKCSVKLNKHHSFNTHSHTCICVASSPPEWNSYCFCHCLRSFARIFTSISVLFGPFRCFTCNLYGYNWLLKAIAWANRSTGRIHTFYAGVSQLHLTISTIKKKPMRPIDIISSDWFEFSLLINTINWPKNRALCICVFHNITLLAITA